MFSASGAAQPTWTDAAGAGFGAASGGGSGGWGAPPGSAASPASAPDAGPTAPTSAQEEEALLLVRAMVAAANIDGQIDAEERQRIIQGAAEAGLSDAEREGLQRELAHPLPPSNMGQY